MPVTTSQHRASCGIYQNKLYHNARNNTDPVRNKAENQPALSDKICRFGKSISQAINNYEERHNLSFQHRAPSQSAIIPALLLLSQIRLTSSPSDQPSFISDRDISPLPYENTIYPENNDRCLNSLLNPVVNALYKTGEMISRYDPLRFPGADAASLSAITPESVTTPDIHFLSESLTQRANELIFIFTEAKQVAIMREIIDELNNISIEAEKAFPSSSSGYKNIHHLIYLIDKSKYLIDKFEIKHEQTILCEILRLQRDHYIEMAKSRSDDESIFMAYLEALPWENFNPSSRASPLPTFESQIADKLVKSVFGFDDEQGETSVYGSHYDAYKTLLAFLLVEKKISNIDNLPDDWDKGDEDIRLVNILLRDLELNLSTKGWIYLVRPAKTFCQFYNDALETDNSLSNKERKKRQQKIFTEREQFYLLMNTVQKPIEIEYNQQPDSPRFFKLLDLFATIQCITEAMHPGHLPKSGKNINSDYNQQMRDIYNDRFHIYNSRFEIKTNNNDYHHKPRVDTHHIRSYQQCKTSRNLRPEYNRNPHELTIYPTSGRNKKLKENDVKMEKIINENKKIDKIRFTPNVSLRNIKNHSSISKEVNNLIMPEMYVDNINKRSLSLPDDFGLIHDTHGNKYLRVNGKIVKIQHIIYPPDINNRYVIEGNENLYLRYRKNDKFHPETFPERLNADRVIDFGEIISGVEPLTLDERDALRTYGRTGPNDINKFIISEVTKNSLTANLTSPTVKIIDNIQHALDKIIPYKGVVYKYIIMSMEEFNSLRKGQLFTSTTFLSCTKNPKVANRWLADTENSTNTPGMIMFEFNIIKSGHSLEWYTEKFHEEEILIERNKYFKINNINSDKKTISLDEWGGSLLSDEEKSLAYNIDFKI